MDYAKWLKIVKGLLFYAFIALQRRRRVEFNLELDLESALLTRQVSVLSKNFLRGNFLLSRGKYPLSRGKCSSLKSF